MKIQELTSLFPSQARRQALDAMIADKSVRRISATSLSGSAAAMALAALPKGKMPVIVVGSDPDDAGYLFHDLSRLVGEQAVAFFPSAYKRDIKFGRIDPPAEILRTEALSRWHSDKNLRFVVTSPEGLAEKVASRSEVDSSILRLTVGKEVDLTETQKWLRSNSFTQVDYVYEPGQFAVRGSILDIFGYSNELPYRIDFFGDEIDSIRTFDIETQLSREQENQSPCPPTWPLHPQAARSCGLSTPRLSSRRDGSRSSPRVMEIASQQFSPSGLVAGEGDPEAMKQAVDPDEFVSDLNAMKQLSFTASDRPEFPGYPVIDYDCTPRASITKTSTSSPNPSLGSLPRDSTSSSSPTPQNRPTDSATSSPTEATPFPSPRSR